MSQEFNISEEDQQLLNRLRSGDKEAFTEIYCNYYNRLFNFALDYLNDYNDTSDIIQNVFTKLWIHKNELQPKSNIGAWLFTITRNESLSLLFHRRIIRTHHNQEKARLLDINIDSLRKLDLSNLTLFNIYDLLEKGIAALPPQCRKVFLLSRSKRINNNQIARELSISVKTVEAHMSKALKILRNYLSDYLP